MTWWASLPLPSPSSRQRARLYPEDRPATLETQMCKEAEKLFRFKRVVPQPGSASTAGCSNGRGSATFVNLGVRPRVPRASCPQPALALTRARLLSLGLAVRDRGRPAPGLTAQSWGAGCRAREVGVRGPAPPWAPLRPTPWPQTGSGVPRCCQRFSCTLTTLDSRAIGIRGGGSICQ